APLRAASQSKPRGKSPIRRLLALADLDRRELGAVAVYALAMGAMTLAVPVAVQALVNTVAFGTVLQPLVVLSLMLAMGLAFTATLRVLQTVVVERLQRRLFVRVATDFVRRLSRLSPAVRERYHGPELANRFFEVLTLQKAGAALLTDGLALALQLLVGTLLLAFYHPVLLAFDLALMLAVVGVIVLAGRGAVDSSLAESTRKYAVAAWLEEVAGVQRFGDAAGRRVADERGELLIREWLQARSEHFRRLLRQHLGGVSLQVIASTALLGIGGWLVIRRQLTLGQLVAAELVVTAIGAGLGKLGKQLESFYDATTAAEKLGKVVDLELVDDGGKDGDAEMAARARMGVEAPTALRPSMIESRTPRAAVLLARMLMAGMVVVALTLAFAPWQQSVAGTGRVIAYAPLERQQLLEAPIEGRIVRWHVQEGSRVSAGEPIAELSDNDPEILARLERERQAAELGKNAAAGAVEVAKTRIEALEIAGDAKRSSAGLRVDMARARLDGAERAVDAAEAADRTAALNLER
ncbi:MAG: biotin/lipoyl-binding protein, partial [Myxococcales bacterium]|nr:biotin/lipoyl-binding protein [Myxococcales bacterium]